MAGSNQPPCEPSCPQGNRKMRKDGKRSQRKSKQKRRDGKRAHGRSSAPVVLSAQVKRTISCTGVASIFPSANGGLLRSALRLDRVVEDRKASRVVLHSIVEEVLVADLQGAGKVCSSAFRRRHREQPHARIRRSYPRSHHRACFRLHRLKPGLQTFLGARAHSSTWSVAVRLTFPTPSKRASKRTNHLGTRTLAAGASWLVRLLASRLRPLPEVVAV